MSLIVLKGGLKRCRTITWFLTGRPRQVFLVFLIPSYPQHALVLLHGVLFGNVEYLRETFGEWSTYALLTLRHTFLLEF